MPFYNENGRFAQVMNKYPANSVPPDGRFSRATLLTFLFVCLLFIGTIALVSWLVIASF